MIVTGRSATGVRDKTRLTDPPTDRPGFLVANGATPDPNGVEGDPFLTDS